MAYDHFRLPRPHRPAEQTDVHPHAAKRDLPKQCDVRHRGPQSALWRIFQYIQWEHAYRFRGNACEDELADLLPEHRSRRRTERAVIASAAPARRGDAVPHLAAGFSR